MFQRTRIRLAAQHTLILFVVLNIFGGVVYLYMHNLLYRQIDASLLAMADHLQRGQYRDISRPYTNERGADRRIVYLLWDRNRQILVQTPQEAFFSSDLTKLRPNSNVQEFRTINIEGHKYRSLYLPVPAQDSIKLTGELQALTTVQLALNMEPENNVLNNLIVIVLVGGVLGGLVSLLAGLFMANRALIPIRESWDKQQHFVADASHELRTPLAVIQAQLELLFRHPNHTIEQDSSKISAVLAEVQRMSKMITQLLTLARSDSNQVDLERKEFSLNGLVADTGEQFKQLASTKQITLNTVLDENVKFFGDKERIKQMLIILLDNALKYTPQKGEIKLTCKQTKHNIKLTVEDSGIGIPKEDLPFIFDRFYRGDKVRSRGSGGAGLGLAIAKWIVSAHQGTISVESGLAEGSKFTLVFPGKRLR